MAAQAALWGPADWRCFYCWCWM